MYKVLIIEDEKPAAEWFQQNPAPDLVFMDIQLADGLSFGVFERGNVTSPVIFTTAYGEYAIKKSKTDGVTQSDPVSFKGQK